MQVVSSDEGLVSPTPSTISGFRPDVQGLRGIAVLAVVLFHAGVWLPGGFVGVDVFFVLSGFVITRLLVRELGDSGGLSLSNFYSRRARRLLPAFATFSTVTLLLSVLLLSPLGSQAQQHALRTGAFATLFSGNWFLYFRGGGYWGPSETLNPFLHTWSLGVEEQFYLFLPAALLLVWRLVSRRRAGPSQLRTLAVSIGVVSVLSFLLSWALSTGTLAIGSPERLAFYGTPMRVWEFGAGALVALAEVRLQRINAVGRFVLGVAGGLLLAYSCVMFDESTVFPGSAAVLPVAGTMALMVAGAGLGPVRTALSWRPLTWIGDRSYGWYLWHWPAIVFAGVLWPTAGLAKPIAAVASIVPTVLSFRFVEQRVRLNRKISGLRALRMASFCIAGPLVLAAGAYFGASHGWGLEAPPEWAEHGVSFTAGCHAGDQEKDPWSEQSCLFGVDNPKGLILLLGDSHGAAASSGVVEAGNSDGYDVAVWTRSACPFVIPKNASDQPGCDWWELEAVGLVDKLRPDLVVVINRSSGYTLTTEMVTDNGVQIGGKFSSKQDRVFALNEWTRRFDGMLHLMDERKMPTLVVSDVPNWGLDFPDGSVSLVRPHPRVADTPRQQLERSRRAWVEAESDLVAKYPLASVLDPFDIYCPGQNCSPKMDGSWNYFDDNHLTKLGSLRMVDPLQDAIAGALAGPKG
ncbi:MAG: acyltransferase family protein [Microthrixaceae bacterium]